MHTLNYGGTYNFMESLEEFMTPRSSTPDRRVKVILVSVSVASLLCRVLQQISRLEAVIRVMPMVL